MPGVLWAVSNDSDDVDLAVVGYSAAQVALSSYAGAPSIYWALNYNSVGHGIGLLSDGGIGVAISEYDESGNGAESWVYVPNRNRGMSYVEAGVTPGANLIRVDSLSNWPDALAYGARDVLQLATGEVILTRGHSALLTLDQFKGLDDHTGANCTTFDPDLLGWDTKVLSGNTEFWMASDSDTIAAIPIVELTAGGTVAAVRVLQGANIGSSTLGEGVNAIQQDEDGGLWWTAADLGDLRYLDAAAIAALTATPSNPTPTRILTSTSFGAAPQFLDLCMDDTGGMWVLTYEAPSRFLYFSAAQLAAGGEQEPEREITLTINYAVSPRITTAPVYVEPPAEPSSFEFWFDAGEDASSTITLAAETNRTSGVAPLAVYFDAKGSYGDNITEYIDLKIGWDFDDDQGLYWDYGAMAGGTREFPKAQDRTPQAAHVYTLPGTYEVTYEARDSLGHEKVSAPITITVEDPDDEFSGTDTVLVSTGSDFTRGVGEYVGASEQTVATGTNLSTLGALLGAGKRVLLKNGDAWAATGTLTMNNVGPCTLGSWGSGAKPIISGGALALGDSDPADDGDLRIIGINFQDVGIDWQGVCDNVLLMDCDFTDESVICSGSVMNFFGLDVPDGVFIVDCTFNGVPSGSGNNIIFIGPHRLAIMGCSIQDSNAGEHVVRCPWIDRGVVAHNYIADAPTGRHVLKIHAPDYANASLMGAGSPSPGSPNPNFPAGRSTNHASFHDNHFAAVGATQWMLAFTPQNDTQDERGENIIFERNLIDDAEPTAIILFATSQTNMLIAANIFRRTESGAQCIRTGIREGDAEEISHGSSNIQIVNNTFYGEGDSEVFLGFEGESGSGSAWANIISKNNIMVLHTQPVDAEYTATNDLTGYSASSFVTVPPVDTQDFAPPEGATAIGLGISSGAPAWDAVLKPVNFGVSNEMDCGAIQYAEEEEPPPDPEDIEFVAAGTALNAATNGGDVGAPAGIAAGDFLVCILAWRGSGTPTMSGDWTVSPDGLKGYSSSGEPVPILYYKMDEASSGTSPTALVDSGAGTAYNLPITYGSSSWTSIASGNGLSSGAGQARARSTDNLDTGDKLYDQIHGTQDFVFECRLRVDSLTDAVSNIMNVGDSAIVLQAQSNGALAFTVVTTGGNSQSFSDENAVTVGNTYTIHAVRLSGSTKIYVDNVDVSFAGSHQNGTIALNGGTLSDRHVALLARSDGGGANSLTMFSAGFYGDDVDSTVRAAHHTALSANNDASPAPAADTFMTWYYHAYDGDAPSYTVTRTGSDCMRAQVFAYSGVDSGDPIDATAFFFSSGGTSATSVPLGDPELETVTANAMVLGFAAEAGSSSLSTPSGSSGITWTERAEGAAGSGSDVRLALSDGLLATPGTVDDVITAGSSGRHVGMAIALKPAA